MMSAAPNRMTKFSSDARAWQVPPAVAARRRRTSWPSFVTLPPGRTSDWRRRSTAVGNSARRVIRRPRRSPELIRHRRRFGTLLSAARRGPSDRSEGERVEVFVMGRGRWMAIAILCATLLPVISAHAAQNPRALRLAGSGGDAFVVVASAEWRLDFDHAAISGGGRYARPGGGTLGASPSGRPFPPVGEIPKPPRRIRPPRFPPRAPPHH